ncbi:fimbrial biogenesis chaperone [Thalassospira marina]|nr:molecular chaperone [Thalassospira marina]
MASVWLGLALLVSGAFPSGASAAALRVSPVLLDLIAPTSATGLRIWNDSNQSVDIQVRVFRWVQKDGQQSYQPTTDVVASPPISTLQAGSQNIIRIVRVSRQPVVNEESYRLVVDELPSPSLQEGGNVTVVLRHSIPLFFSQAVLDQPDVEWNVQTQSDGSMRLDAVNRGPRRLKISNLSLSGQGNEEVRYAGLLGYVLGNSKMSWVLNGAHAFAGPYDLTADSEAGQFSAVDLD